MPGYLLRTSEAASLALHAAVHVAGCPGQRLSSQEIADAIQAPPRHLGKVLSLLTRAGLLDAKRGPGGGFTLTRPPRTIWLRELYEAVIGRSHIGGCTTCREVDSSSCPVERLWDSVDCMVVEYLSTTTLADLLTPPGRGVHPRLDPQRRLGTPTHTRPSPLAASATGHVPAM